MDNKPGTPGELVKRHLANSKRHHFSPVGEYGTFWMSLDAVGIRIWHWLTEDCGISDPDKIMKLHPYIDRRQFEENTAQWVEQYLRQIEE
jgi:hypothetical protein